MLRKIWDRLGGDVYIEPVVRRILVRVHLHDIARVDLGQQYYSNFANLGGLSSAQIVVFALPEANAIAVANQVYSALAEMSKEFPDGMKFLPDQRLFVFREGNVFHAISAVCTHLSCTVRAEALSQVETRSVEGSPLKITHRFLCPCHGSRYTGDGQNVAGPAPKPLAWYHLAVAPDDGQLVVDLANPVARNFRLTIA